MDKASLRRQMKEKRAAVPEGQALFHAEYAAHLLARHPAFRAAKRIALYRPIRSEANTAPMARLCSHKPLLYPRCGENGLEMIPVSDATRWDRGAFGIPEPAGLAETELSDVLVIVPALAIDRSGYRLGWGGGWYDRFFAEHRVFFRLGYIYDFQLADRLEREPHDIPLDDILF